DVRSRFDAVCRGYEVIREHAPDLSAPEVDDFLERVSRMTGRELPVASVEAGAFAWGASPAAIQQAVRETRSLVPLRKRIRATTDELAAAVSRFQNSAKAGEWESAFRAFREAFPDTRWEVALSTLDDAYSAALPDVDRARLWCETASVLRERF